MFDPDYRKSPWNRSRFAPRRFGTKSKSGKGNGITIFAFVLAVLITSPAWYLVYTGSAQYITVTFGVTAVLWVGLSIIVRRREYRRLTQPAEEKKSKKSLDKKDKKSRKKPIDTRPTEIHTSAIPPSLKHIDNSQLDPTVFEEEIAWLITATTGHKAEVVGGSSDQGIDIEVYGKSGKRIGIVQCKRYDPSRPLPPNHVRELFAVKRRFRVPTAYLATTTYFSDSTRQEARELGIRLMDGTTIRRMQKKAHSGLFQ